MNTDLVLALTCIQLIASFLTISAQDYRASTERTQRKRFTCPDESTISDCSCQEFGTQFMFSCPEYNPTLEITMNEAIQAVQIKCRVPYELDGLPNLGIGNINLLVVKACVLNETKSILETFEFLGVNNVRALLYDDYYNLQTVRYHSKHFEGLESLENLTLTRGAGIETSALRNLSNLRRLNIQFNKVDLQPEMFEGLRDLKVLNLEYNKITHLEEGLFKSLGNLEVLSLARNNIKHIHRDVFAGLDKVQILDLRSNEIPTLDADVFALLPELVELNIGVNPISRFPEGMLSRNLQLKTFGLRINKAPLESIPEGLLANLPELKVVHLDFSKISHLPDWMFHNSTEIIELNMSHNRLSHLPVTLLQDQRRLQELNLAHNLLEVIPDQLLDENHELITLRLSNNRLESLSGNVFRSLKNLKKLYLENNALRTIDHFTFTASRALEELHLQNNQLAFHANSFIEDEFNLGDSDNTPFQYLAKLRTLKLHNNNISTIYLDWNINNLELQELDLSNNQITQLQYADLQFQSNISVNLANNNISLVSLSMDQVSLRTNQKIIVDLSNNPLDCNCNVLEFVKYVQDKSNVGSLQFYVDHLSCARPERLLHAPVTEVKPEELKCMLTEGCPADCTCDLRLVDYTIVVDCNGLGLTRIPQLPQPSSFEGFESIELHFEDNRLSELPNSQVLGYGQVTQLYLRNNSIAHLRPDHLPVGLRQLDLSENLLQSLNDSTVIFLNQSGNLSSIKLSNNRWRCNCKTSHLLNFIQRNQYRIDDISEVRCANTDLPLVAVTVNDLCSQELTRVMVICVTLAIVGLTVGLLSTLFYRYQTEVKVWLFTHNLFLWIITEEELDRDKRYDAFISYSHLDEDFVTEQLVPTLEKEPMNFKTCWHVRDFMPGEMIITQIIKSIEDSRRTVIVLSKNFLQSHWAKEEFRQAHVQSMEDRRVRVIVVIYDDIGDVEKLDPELRAYLKTNTYVKWGDPWFWDKLRYAMPHPLKIKGLKRVEKEILLDKVDATVPKTELDGIVATVTEEFSKSYTDMEKGWKLGAAEDSRPQGAKRSA